MKLRKYLALAAAALILAGSGSAAVSAIETETDDTLTTTTATEQSQRETRAAARRERLEGVKLKACQNREKNIQAKLSRIADRGEKQLNLFSNIADRAKTFYANHHLTASNYDSLVADVAAKKSAAQTALQAIKNAGANFRCNAEDPKGSVETFKTGLKSEIEALQAFRTSVKNLIVGIKSAAEGSQQ